MENSRKYFCSLEKFKITDQKSFLFCDRAMSGTLATYFPEKILFCLGVTKLVNIIFAD